jgi:Carbohydrate family 9 binding domain-like
LFFYYKDNIMRNPSETALYSCYRTPTPLTIDGSLDEPAWQKAPRSPRFVDVVNGAPGLYDTTAAALWDDQYLYVGFWVEEPWPKAQITERDELIFLENDVEVFIDGGDSYYEFEINALGTIYEVFFIWQDAYQRGGFVDMPEFDILKQQAISFGGNHDRTGAYFWRGSHPRGLRWAYRSWDLPGLKSAVVIDGTLNDSATASKGWTVELAFPWAGMQQLANGRSLPPQHGDQWRIFFGRYQQVEMNGNTQTVGWAWDPIGSHDNHVPERFTPIQFSDAVID